ncbi:hypothetical protein C1632_02390 [Microbacterium testaceum]|nr:hypothetical protein C1632_02390 [Microbacterium testaceum]
MGEGETENQIGAYELAQTLEGLVELTKELSKSGEFGNGPAPDLRVRPVQQGSFVLEAVVWLQDNPITGAGLGLAGVAATAAAKQVGTAAGKAIVDAVAVGVRQLRGQKPVNFEPLENGDVKVTWEDKSVSQVRGATWDKLQKMKRPTRKALQKLLAPLNDDATRLELRDAPEGTSTNEILSQPPEAIARREDYLETTVEPDDSFEDEDWFESEARIRSLDFDNNRKWRVETTGHGTRQAIIEDVNFLANLDRPGEAIHQNDIFWIKVREVRSKERGRNATTEWIVTEVKRTKRGASDGDTEGTPTPVEQ